MFMCTILGHERYFESIDRATEWVVKLHIEELVHLVRQCGLIESQFADVVDVNQQESV